MDFRVNNVDPSSLALNKVTNVPVSTIASYVPTEQNDGNSALGELADILLEANKSSDNFEKEQLKGLLSIDVELSQIEQEILEIEENGKLALEKAEILLERLREIEQKLNDIEKKLLEYKDISERRNADTKSVENRMLELDLLRRQVDSQRELNRQNSQGLEGSEILEPEQK